MGVPISFLDKYCPEQFEIMGITKTWFGGAAKIYPNQIQVNANGKRSQGMVSKLNDGAAIKMDSPPLNKTYYIVDDAYYTQAYVRILIKRNDYIKGAANRQDFLATALSWVAASKGQETDNYMAAYRFDNNINELKTYFNTVIDWISAVFRDVEKEMCGLDWGRLYEEFHKRSYNPSQVSSAVQRLYGDVYVKNRRGIFEYILGGETDTRLLEIRVFDDAVKQAVYKQQTDEAKSKGVSNCPYCAAGHDAGKNKIWAMKDMDADHVSAWSKGGTTDIKNCQILFLFESILRKNIRFCSCAKQVQPVGVMNTNQLF